MTANDIIILAVCIALVATSLATWSMRRKAKSAGPTLFSDDVAFVRTINPIVRLSDDEIREIIKEQKQAGETDMIRIACMVQSYDTHKSFDAATPFSPEVIRRLVYDKKNPARFVLVSKALEEGETPKQAETALDNFGKKVLNEEVRKL